MMSRMLCVLLFAALPARAAVIGMVAASPVNKIRIEVIEKENAPLLVVKQWGRDCPIAFAPGTPFSGELKKVDRAGKTFLVLSLYDDAPVLAPCPAERKKKPGLQTFRLRRLLAQLDGAEKEFFENGATLVLVFGEQQPGGYDGRLAAAKVTAAEIRSEAKAIYESPFDGARPF